MNDEYTHIEDIYKLLSEIPADSIVSRTFFSSDQSKGILFGFAPGQELSEHTAARPAILQFLKGKADLKLGDEHFEAQEGTWVHMPANLPHSVLAKTDVVMLLYLL